MAICKYCNKSGWFLSVTEGGLCKSCDPIFWMEFEQRFRIMNRSMALVEKSKKLDTQILRCDVVMEHALALVQFEEKGIPTTDPNPSEIAKSYQRTKDILIFEGMKFELGALLEKVELVQGTKTKLTRLSKYLLRIQNLKSKSNYPKLLEPMESEVKQFIHKVQLNSYLDAARKAESKRQKKKALDKYYEALYFLRNDEIDDSEQSRVISSIEAKIIDLGGNIR